jgi:hypothetical protein
MHALLTAIVIWISANFGLPATDDLPNLKFVPKSEMAQVRYGRLATVRPDRVAVEHSRSPSAEAAWGVYSFYDIDAMTIYLPEDWTAVSPADISMLVHEMVHHMQNLAGVKYECAEAREKLAYSAQSRWLELFGRTIAGEFKIDPMTILVRTNCMF